MAISLDRAVFGAHAPRHRWVAILIGFVLLVMSVAVAQPANAACSGNAIVCENELPGTPKSEWDIEGSGDPTIQGFATNISVNAGQQIDFKIKTDASAYSIKIYRLGYYGGDGAREVATVNPSVSLPQQQPACVSDTSTDLYDCGTWGVSASWQVPSSAVSGIYIARPVRSDTGGDSHIVFVVRNDGNTSNVLFQTSDSTWQAYNLYGGADFYSGGTNRTQAVKVSYNRPFATRGGIEARDWLFSNEYPMLRFLEQNGYDVSYVSGLDVSTDPALLPKHKVFLSVGHDEYWSKQQRANVTAARDAGVNLAFFSGNEVYWKTRWEPSQDGSNTANRTLVTYKDTWANAPVDPVESTPTWRDPRFGDLGFGPENSLTGTMFQSNNVDLALTVSSDEGKYRLWRNTSLTSLSSGTSVALAAHTVGYEADEDVDNGYRPAGLVNLSTTTGATPEYLRDYGNTVTPGTTTHHVTLYRAASGALVFSAGTVQWSWGLDTVRDGTQQAADPRIRQATANVLADMRALPTTLAADLVMPTTSTDTTGPTVTITSPDANADITQGSLVTVKGTATDVGGRVAGVEVSVDGGLSFHPATGTTTWSYKGILTGNGASAIQVRAADDSANLGATANLLVNAPCPCSIFGAATPTLVDAGDSSDVTLGTRFTASSDGFILGVRFYKAAANTGEHTGSLYSESGVLLATGTFTNETSDGWQTLLFDSAVPVTANTVYVTAYHAPNGHYAADAEGLARKFVAGPLTALANPNGVYALGNAFPTATYNRANYWVDVMFSQTDTRPVTLSAQTPPAGATSVLTNTSVSAVMSKSVVSSSVVASLVDGTGASIPGSTSYNSDTRKVTFNPTQALAPGVTYTVTIGADGMAAPGTWSFTTVAAAPPAGTCPCSVFTESDQPAFGPDIDTASVTLGMAFHPTVDGEIAGVRFFKNAENYGTRRVALWSAAGTLLAEASSTSESPLGWQQVSFATPVSVAKNSVYIVSYVAPRGRYGYTAGGLNGAVTRGPLTTETSGGRYAYGGTAPTNTSSANYFVDVVFNRAAGDAPTVTKINPANGATSVPVTASVEATFSTDITPGVTNVKVTKHSDGSTVAGVVGNESQGSLVTFMPSQSLAPGTTYDVEVSGAQNLAGVPMSGSFTSSFTTSGATACPCSLLSSTSTPGLVDSNDTGAVTLGLRFASSVNGVVTGLRYYRAAANTGVHKGALWSSTGTKLAELTFTDGAAGWTTATFSTPVSITADSTYVASYYAPNGHYSADLDFYTNVYTNTPLRSVGSGGVYTYADGFPSSNFRQANYYVDVLFDTASDTPPSVSTTTPASDATSVLLDSAVSATFSKAITESSINFTVATASDGNAISGQVAYDSATGKVTFTPTTKLLINTKYRATLTANSASGVAMTAPKVWEFTTTAVPPASVTAVSPLDAAVGIDPASTVTATFSDSTKASSVALTLKKGSTAVAGTTTYDPTTRVATFTPTSPLDSLTDYTASAMASNTDDVAMSAAKTWTFTTKDTVPVNFSTLSPASAATAVALNSTVTAVASKAIDQSTLVMGLTAAGGATVAGATSYDPTSRTVTFTPTAPLSSDTIYTVSVRAKSASGVDMSSAQTWSFTTVDTLAPVVSSTMPTSAATAVAVTTKVTAVFAKQIDPATLTMALSPTVAGTTTYDASSKTATFTPTASLGSATGYTVTVNAKSTGGTAMLAKTWSFTTADVTAPVVSSTTPAASATGVALTAPVTAVFAKAIDPASLTMSLSPAITGTTTYNATTRTATFTPSAALTSSTSYTVTVNAKSTGGTAMTAKTWSFTTTTADYSVFASTATPATRASTATTPITVGMRFSSTRSGKVVAIKFWAASTNTGTTVTLRSSSGTVLGTAVTSGTGTGWRTATFSTPIAITAGTVYVASYYAPVGRYAATTSGFAAAVTNGPLTIPASGGRYASGNANPTLTTTTNLWVDVVVRI